MDGPSTRTLTTALVVIAAATLLAQTLTASASLDNNNRKQSRRRRSKNDSLDPQYVTGLVNVGNTCFMNSVLQAMASLPSLRSYLEARKDMGHDQDSITFALYETIEMLNVHHRRQTAQRLVRMIKAVKAKAAQVLTSQQQAGAPFTKCEKLDHPGTLSLLDRMTVSEILNPSPSTHMKRRPSVSSVMFSSLSSIHNNKFQKSPPSSPSSPDAIENANGIGTEGDSNTDPVMTESLVLDRIEQDKYRRAKSPFMGLLASRVSCVDCGYTAAIRHSTFDNLSLTVPLQYACCLEDCLESFIHLDTISDFKCRKCTLIKASKDLAVRIEQCKTSLLDSQERNDDQHGDQDLQDQHGQFKQNRNANRRHQRRQPSPAANTTMDEDEDSHDEDFEIATSTESSLLRMEEVKSLIDQCLFGDIEMDLAPIELEPVRSKRTTKHSMIAKPPQVLCLHLNRSMFTDQGQMAKNPCRVQFGSWLDFTRFTTSGYLTTVATRNMSRRGSAAVSTISSEGSNGSMGFMNTGAGVSTGIGSIFPPRGGLRRPSLTAPWPSSVGNASLKVGANAARERSSPDQEMDSPQDEEGDERVLYRLCAVVEHLGSHNSGHFVTYRRIPSSYSGRVSSSSSRLTSGKRRSGADVNDDQGQWWRISDENVQIVEWAMVKNAEAYMLFYEKERPVV
ncbi:hypothetical protein BG011_007627 [Mortierella polycephala]|uniref:Ubiquitin carboxyl-terminal hydrolase n=1 Tax=Mortierella polycephala TaxID=41804 RepID=A0A9P6PPR2_9FUNG|nr:hypothetical protein BG011_007627 [Mortierella polycephala]